MTTNSQLIPLLVVRGAARAIDFYVRALGARVLARYEHGEELHVGHADLALPGVAFSVTEEARSWNSDAPESLGPFAIDNTYYASVNLLWQPSKSFRMGLEYLYGRKETLGGSDRDAQRIDFVVRYDLVR